MLIPDILKDSPHLPIKEDMLSSEAIPLCNTFYETDFNSADFKESQAFIDVDGKVRLELIDPKNNVVLITFVNKINETTRKTLKLTSEGMVLKNPLSIYTEDNGLMTSPVIINDVEEVDFLEGIPTGYTTPIFSATDLPFKLKELFNHYDVPGPWVSGTMGDYCTGGFTLLYKGKGSEAPSEYLVAEDVENVVLIRINEGTNKGVICLQLQQSNVV